MMTVENNELLINLRPISQHTMKMPLQYVDFDTWYNDEVLDDTRMKMTRKNIIENLAEKAGGCHLDPDMT